MTLNKTQLSDRMKELLNVAEMVAKGAAQVYIDFGAEGKKTPVHERSRYAGNVAIYAEFLNQKIQGFIEDLQKILLEGEKLHGQRESKTGN